MFVRSANPIWYLPDLVGLPLNDNYYAFFLTNTLPYLPQNVYRDPQGVTVWTGDVVRFFPNGTLPDNLYFDPNLTYRIEIRRGNSQTDPLIYEINNYVPNQGSSPSPDNSLAIFGNENQVSNSQFALLNFVSPLTITVAGTYSIAPGWELVLTGAGSTTLTQLIFSGDQEILTNPPYALRINNTGWTDSYLRQRLENNGAIWASGAVTMSITARAQTTAENISLIYFPNPPGIPQIVKTTLLGTGDYEVVSGAINLPASVNSTLSTLAYTDIKIQLPPIGIVDITSMQVIGQTDPLPTNFDPDTDIPSYQQESQERMIDHLFHYYFDSLLTQPKNSLLTGWNFGLNPWQFRSVASSNVATNTYTADQTIIVQQAYVASATGNNIAVAQGSLANDYGFTVTAVTATNQFAMIQYIDPATVRPYWNSVLSSLVKAFITSSHATSCRIKMRLLYRASLPSTIAQAEPIASWTALGDPVYAAGWTALTPLNDPVYTLTSTPTEFAFDGFTLPVSTNAAMTLAIVLYTMDPMNQTATADFLVVNDVSLVPNDFAIASNPLSFDETLRRCQYYYEKSYDPSVLPGVSTSVGLQYANFPVFWVDNSGGSFVYRIYNHRFILNYKQIKRAIPSLITFYLSGGTSGSINVSAVEAGLSISSADISVASYTQINTSTQSMTVRSNNNSEATSGTANGYYLEGLCQYHYTVDARLGI